MKWAFVRPAHDDATRKISEWGNELQKHSTAQESDLVADLRESDATTENLVKCLQEHDIGLLIFFGHGNESSLLTNTDPETSLISHIGATVNPPEVVKKGRRIYAVACLAGKGLGLRLAKTGCHFIGYSGNFSFPVNESERFGEVVNNGALYWFNEERTANEVISKLRQDWTALIEDYLFSETISPEHLLNAMFAELNLACLCSHPPQK